MEGSAVQMVPSPAIAIVGRHNSGKTTLVEKLIAYLTRDGLDVGSVKHHSHGDFDIDYPGKDSYRHRQAGATETVISSPNKLARIKTLEHELECAQIVRTMPGHDIVIVEGYRKSGLPTIEIMRAENKADASVAQAFLKGAEKGVGLGEDFVQLSKGDAAFKADLETKMPTSNTVAIVTDIEDAIRAANIYGIPAFDINDIEGIAKFMKARYARQHVSVVIQAGGESRRMGRSKATVPFDGKPLITRLVSRLSPVADELIITTNEAENLAFLEDEFPGLDIKLVADKYNKRGALPGICTALESARNPFVSIVACDMVFASAALVVAEAIEMADVSADVVVPVNTHGFEPFHATYRKDACLPIATAAVDRGESRAQALYEDKSLKVVEFTQDQVLDIEPRGGCFINANTPDDLKRIEENYLGE